VPLCIFFQLLNIAGVNGHILHNMTRSEDKAQKRRQFLKNLAMGLIKPHMENGALLKNLTVHMF
jgi:chemotaxis receptor (MCP) glutamine deamidase CheD